MKDDMIVKRTRLPLQDAYEESLAQTIYLKQAIEEQGTPNITCNYFFCPCGLDHPRPSICGACGHLNGGKDLKYLIEIGRSITKHVLAISLLCLALLLELIALNLKLGVDLSGNAASSLYKGVDHLVKPT